MRICIIFVFFHFAENLEAKMKWLKNFERVQTIQQQIMWQPITEMEPRAFIPEVGIQKPLIENYVFHNHYILTF